MKDNEVISGHLSPCIRIFIESLLHGQLTTSGRNAGDAEKSIELKKGSRQAKQPEGKKHKVEKMATSVSLILHQFKDVRTSILTLLFGDSPISSERGT